MEPPASCTHKDLLARIRHMDHATALSKVKRHADGTGISVAGMDGILAGSAVGLVAGVLAAALIAHLLLRAPPLAQPGTASAAASAGQARCAL